MEHSSKRTVFEVNGRYLKGLEEDRSYFWTFFGADFLAKAEPAEKPFPAQSAKDHLRRRRKLKRPWGIIPCRRDPPSSALP